MSKNLLIDRLGCDKGEFFLGVAQIVRRDLGIGNLEENFDFKKKIEVSLTGEFAAELIGYTRSEIDSQFIVINYFPNGRVFGFEYNVDSVVNSEFNRQYK